MSLSPRTVGIAAAVVTVAIWTGFIVIGRASAGHTLLPFDIALLRILGAGAVLLPWGWVLARRAGPDGRSLAGFSPLPLRPTVLTGLFGGLVYAILCY
ncbi:MAG: EamA/RhaT family transporter, partial [Burkholderiales bacterium]|nr:EamA/RhaT family transporter [Burkholderiales bacterium]